MMPDFPIILPLVDEGATQKLGRLLGQRVVAGDCIALVGPLGAGKTTLARSLIRAFVGHEVEVPSPTFTLVQRYERDSDTDGSAGDLLHFDLYRLTDPEDVWELGWEDIGESIALVEWPDKAGANMPPKCLTLTLDFDPANSAQARIAIISASQTSNWKDRLHGL